ncbi:hypothetical protein EDB85DRAFT_2228358 [Lactarius pseudohatsudake]|nr:hypothetical protein EDB85DRAFT_2228358 [Lactarius pseudohatsudake]
MSGRPRGRPRKKPRKSQSKPTVDNHQLSSMPEMVNTAASQVHTPHKTPSWKGQGREGSMSDFESDLNPGEQSDDECEEDGFSDLEDEDFAAKLVEMAERDDPNDTEWIPSRLRTWTQTPKERPRTYAKGPDVMSKSLRTRQRYQKEWKSQTTLNSFFRVPGASLARSYTASPAPSMSSSTTIPRGRRASELSSDSSESSHAGEIVSSVATPAVAPISESDVENNEQDGSDESLGGAGEEEDDFPDENEEIMEEWEHELDLAVQSPKEVRDWGELRKQIQDDLKTGHRKLSLSQINQMMILSNFATLRLKGTSRIRASEDIARQWHLGEGVWFARRIRACARHYQTFEQLLHEHRGGYKNARTLLRDENVKKHSLDYLTSLPTGKVTPKAFQNVINTKSCQISE